MGIRCILPTMPAARPLSVTYNGTAYYYATNLQGDITAILNTSGTAVVTYTYDAWGNILSTSGSMAGTLGTHNPLRYRGYVFNAETGLYYVSSRYYVLKSVGGYACFFVFSCLMFPI